MSGRNALNTLCAAYGARPVDLEAIALPIDPFLVAEELGYKLGFVEGGTEELLGDSYIDTGTNDRWIRFNKGNDRQTSRWILAHGIGHHELGHFKGGRIRFRDAVNRGDGSVSEEWQANKFSAELLVPELTLKAVIRHLKITDPRKLADLFDVSLQLMNYRLIHTRATISP